MREMVERWLDQRSSRSSDWPVEELLVCKGEMTVSVVLPALNEESTIGAIVSCIVAELGGSAHGLRRPDWLVDEVVVMDSGSTDRTADAARAAGARVVHRDQVLRSVPSRSGKGEVMWRSLAATTGDVIVFIDADLREFEASYVTGLLGPLFADPSVQLVKAIYDRTLDNGLRVLPAGGGRVTELVARPLINLHWPELAGVAQPLAGEYAARRELLEQLPFPCGYGVELALLVDTLETVGLDAIAQVDLGVRRHRNHDDHKLGRMASEIWQVALDRLDKEGRVRRRAPLGATLLQFERVQGELVATEHVVAVEVRPPISTVAEYAVESAARQSAPRAS